MSEFRTFFLGTFALSSPTFTGMQVWTAKNMTVENVLADLSDSLGSSPC